MAERLHGRPPPETTSKIVGADWSRDDLSGRVSDHVEYVRMDLAETTSTGGLVFDECTFRDVDFALAAHTDAAFVNCTFIVCNFFAASFTGCKFVGTMFDRCTHDRMTLDGGDWSFVGMPGADLHSAHIEGVRMREADLTGVDLRGAILRRTDLTSALMHAVQLDRCDLRGSDIGSVDPWNAGLKAAIITWEQAVVLAAAMGLDVRPE